MKPFVFIGPSLALDQAKEYLDATFLPPVKYGDVYRIVQLYQPQVIGIVDGYFNQVPAVWHKEILWAINQGVSVYGASSMGALRAAELEAVGMIGCGRIFQAYQKSVLPPYLDEVFEDDDEVAVTHAPAEMGYTALSEAMINIRITLARAHQLQIIDLQTRNFLITIAKKLFYPQRRYSHILDFAQQQGMAEPEVKRISHWIADNRMDQKKADAISLLEHINGHPQTHDNHDNSSDVDFIHTSQWQTAISEVDLSHRIESAALNEIRLQGPRYFKLRDLALNSIFAQPASGDRFDAEDLTSLHRSTDLLERCLSHDWQRMINHSAMARFSLSESDQLLLQYLQQTGELDSL